MNFKPMLRFIHTSRLIFATDKSALGTLRKKTGYTFANCKKALELHNNDINKAEQWLKEQAQSLGWAKAVKLEGRNTLQGLVGVLVQNNIGAMVEVNCETDFVARNRNFQQFVEVVAHTCLQRVSEIPINDKLFKVNFDADGLKALIGSEGRSLGDELALLIGNVSENANLRRATCFKVSESLSLHGVTHPTPKSIDSNVALGKYGTIIAIKSKPDVSSDVAQDICQHIVGMSPTKIGDINKDKPAEEKDDESCLLYQEYLLDSSKIVNEILRENNIEVVDFHRFECGENLNNVENVNLAKAIN